MRHMGLIEPPNRADVERKLADLTKHGDREKIARYCNVTASAISQQLDPYNTEVTSWFYRNLEALFGWRQTNKEGADAAFRLLCSQYRQLQSQMDGDDGHAAEKVAELSAAAARVKELSEDPAVRRFFDAAEQHQNL